MDLLKGAEEFCKKYDLRAVLIIARDETQVHTVSHGRTKQDCGLAAMDIQKLRAVLAAKPTSFEDACAAAELVRPRDITTTKAGEQT